MLGGGFACINMAVMRGICMIDALFMIDPSLWLIQFCVIYAVYASLEGFPTQEQEQLADFILCTKI